jgi:hypothetical protein
MIMTLDDEPSPFKSAYSPKPHIYKSPVSTIETSGGSPPLPNMDIFYHNKQCGEVSSPMSSTHAFFSKSIEDAEEIKEKNYNHESSDSNDEDLSEQVQMGEHKMVSHINMLVRPSKATRNILNAQRSHEHQLVGQIPVT